MKKESAAFGIGGGINALVYSAVFALFSWGFGGISAVSAVCGISALIVNTAPVLRSRRLLSCVLMFICAAVSLVIAMDFVTPVFLAVSITLALLPEPAAQKKPRPFLLSGLGIGIFGALLALFPAGFEAVASRSFFIFGYEPFVLPARLLIVALGIAGSALVLRKTFLSGILTLACSAGMFALGFINNDYLLILCGFIYVSASIPALMPEKKPQL